MDNVEQVVQQPPLEYQKLQDIKIEESDENSPEVIPIMVDKDASLGEVYEAAREQFVNENWWFKDRWKEKGLPHEQVTVEFESGKIEVFNWGSPLEQRHLDELGEVIEIFAQIRGGEALKRTQYVLIDNKVAANPLTGKVDDLNGYGAIGDKALSLHPRALLEIEHRVTGVSNFKGTVTHELTHSLTGDIVNEWKLAFGWEDLNNSRQQTRQPEKCVDDYAKINPEEDICESMVAAIWKPEVLDPEKLQFLDREMGIEQAREKQLPIRIVKKTGNDIALPSLEGPIKFRRAGEIKIG